MNNNTDLIDAIKHIDPALLSYEEWIQVGMGLKEDGQTVDLWDDWSSRDIARYKSGECQKKWESFRGSHNPVTAGTVVQLAINQGYTPPQSEGYALDWDDVIGAGKKDHVIVDKTWLEGKEISEPKTWNPAQELIKYLELLFETNENVGYVVGTYEKEGRYLPKKGNWDRTAGELIELLNGCSDIGEVLGDYKEDAGAWIRFNPLDGNGIKNDNVTEFRYALVESDSMPVDEQNAIIRELELPVACMVHSGGKSLHAIVKIEAKDYSEYRKRVEYLYNVCRKNGLDIDSQNKNPSRLSRMPGVIRKGRKQFIVDSNIGKRSWADWEEWFESVNDDLPEPESLTDTWDNLPELSPPLIDGVLRQGHKMLLAGPSKAGKSYALIELAIAIAEGKSWINFPCTQGRILYVNLELDRASCLHRYKDVYQALNIPPRNLKNIDIWNLRGKSVPMDKLAPKLIRRAAKKNYIAIIIDPIYKVITGDENSADQMAHFCNQFDLVCHELGAAVIYCHHHSKGVQGGKKSMDRASGSGVFARDPDALLDLIELELTEHVITQRTNNRVCDICRDYINEYGPEDWDDKVPLDHRVVEKLFIEACEKLIPYNEYKKMLDEIEVIRAEISNTSGWRIEGTMREYPKFAPVNLWFEYPVHVIDDTDVLKDVESEGEAPFWQKGQEKRKKRAKSKRERQRENTENAITYLSTLDGHITLQDISEYLSDEEEEVSKEAVKKRIKRWFDDKYEVEKGTGKVLFKDPDRQTDPIQSRDEPGQTV